MSEDINVGAISEALNNKADRDMVNSIPPYIVSRTPNEQGGVVEIWSDGYCVQNGVDNTGSGTKTITLSQPYIASNYVVLLTGHNATNAYTASVSGRFTDYFNVYKANTQCYWETKGYIR